MTGWRLGYCAAPPQLADVLRKLQEPQVSCPSAISQHAAEAVLRGPRDEFDAMRAAYRERRDRAVETAAAHGLDVFRTQGTFYMLVDIARLGAPGARVHAAAARRVPRRGRAGRGLRARRRRARPHLVRGRAGRPGRGHGAGSPGRSRPSRRDGRLRCSSTCGARRDELVDFARELVATPSPNPPGDERAVAALVVEQAARARRHADRDGGVERGATEPARARGRLRRPHADPLRPPRHEAARRSRRVAPRPVRRDRRGRRAPRRRLRRHEGRRRGDGVRARRAPGVRPRIRRGHARADGRRGGRLPLRAASGSPSRAGSPATRRCSASRAGSSASGRRSTPSRAAPRSSRCGCAGPRCTRASPTGCRP